MSDYHPEGVSRWDHELTTEDRLLVGLAADALEDAIDRSRKVARWVSAGETVPDPDGSVLHDLEADAAFRRLRALDKDESC